MSIWYFKTEVVQFLCKFVIHDSTANTFIILIIIITIIIVIIITIIIIVIIFIVIINFS